MRKRFTRIMIFVAFVIVLGAGYNFVSVHFSGEGKDTPEQALPADSSYEWIEGPTSEKEQRYFFLSQGNYFGTEIVTKNFKGWRQEGTGASTLLPKSLKENQIKAAYSDDEILFGLIKPKGEVKVTVNNEATKRLSFKTLPEEVLDLYEAEGYEIWYIDLSKLKDAKKYRIQILDENNSLISELSI